MRAYEQINKWKPHRKNKNMKSHPGQRKRSVKEASKETMKKRKEWGFHGSIREKKERKKERKKEHRENSNEIRA